MRIAGRFTTMVRPPDRREHKARRCISPSIEKGGDCRELTLIDAEKAGAQDEEKIVMKERCEGCGGKRRG